jgi:hypothetical protein
VRESLQAKEKSDISAVAAVDDKFGQGWGVEQVDEELEVIPCSARNRNSKGRQSWEAKPGCVWSHVGYAEV